MSQILRVAIVHAGGMILLLSSWGISDLRAQSSVPPGKQTSGDPYFTPSLHRESAIQTSGARREGPLDIHGQDLTNASRGEAPRKREADSGGTPTPRSHWESNRTANTSRSGEFIPNEMKSRGTILRSGDEANPIRQVSFEEDQETTSARQIRPATPAEEKPAGSLESREAPNAPADQQAFELGQVVAVVGGEPIYVGDLFYEANVTIAKAMPNAPEAVKSAQRGPLMKMLIPKLVDSTLLYVSTVRGLPDGVDVDDVLEQAAVEFDDNALPELMEQAGVKTAAMFDANLRLMGSSLRKMREKWTREQLTRYFLSQQLEIESNVSHREMLEHYEANLAKYEIPERARWEQVMVRFDRFPTRREARKAIVEMGNQIVYGAQLEAVAKRGSHGFQADSGGQQGWVNRGDLASAELDKAIFSIPVGELSDIIETANGLHIIRVQERQEATRTPFLEAQVEIRKAIEEEKRESAFQKHLEKLRSEIPVEIYEEVLGVEN